MARSESPPCDPRLFEAQPGSPTFRLADTTTGATLVTLTGFDDGTWIAITADAFWTGSEKACQRLAFFRGDRPLPEADLDARRQPDRIRALLPGQL